MKRLSLRAERLQELDADELSAARGAAYTGNPACAFSIARPCVSNICVTLSDDCEGGPQTS